MMLAIGMQAQIYQVGETFVPTENNPYGNVYQVTNNNQSNLECCMAECKAEGDVVLPFEVKDTKGGTGYVFKMTSTGQSSYKNPKIRSLSFPEGLKTISIQTMYGTSNILACYIPSTVTTWSDVQSNSTIAKIVVSPDNEYFKSSEDGTALIKKSNNELIILTNRSLPNVTWNETDKWGSSSNDWTTITEYTEAHVPEGVEHITTYALKSTYQINKKPITDIYFPSTLIDWDDECFGYYPDGWINIHVAEGNPYWKDRDGIVYSAPTTDDYWTDTDGEKYGTTLKRVPDYRYEKNRGVAITIPEGVKTIKKYAFKASRLGSVTFSSTVTTIEDQAFFQCGYLQTVTLGKNVEEVSSNSFLGCNSLSDIFVVQGNANYSNGSYNEETGLGDGILFNKNCTILMTCPPAKTGEYVIPDATLTVAKNAFSSSNLDKITMGKNVTTIENSAFSSMRKKQAEMYVGPNVENVGDYAFNNSSFGKVIIGNKVKALYNATFWSGSIDEFVFEENSTCKQIGGWGTLQAVKMDTFTFPASVETIGGTTLGSTVKHVVFEDGSHLQSIQAAFTTATNLETIDFGTGHVNDFTLNGTCKGLQKLTSVSIPAECTVITGQCFMNCTNLKNVTFGEGSKLKTIGSGVFAFSGLESITLPDNLVKIETGAFKECTLLTDVHVPSTTTSIHPLSFLDCSSLVNIDVARDNQTYATSDGMLCNKKKQKLIIYPAGKITDSFNLICPSITTIGEYSFYDAKNLKSIVIPKKVTKIENYAFYLCDNLKMITFLGDVRPSSVETDVATDNAKSDDNQRDHRFGNMTNRGADYIKKFVTINIRKNQNTQDSFKASDSYWYGAEPRTSFEATYQNSTRTDGFNQYEYMFMSDKNELGVVQCNSTDHTAVMPATAKWTDENEYPVKLIADYAFEAIPESVKEMVFLGPIEYVGANAFNNGHLDTYKKEPTSNIENIFFTDYSADVKNTFSTVRFGLNSNAKGTELYGDWSTDNYPEFTDKQNVYVPKSKEANYKTDWAVNFADQISYKIPDMQIGTKYGTFAREFDVDFSDCAANGGDRVIAFTTGVKEEWTGDFGPTCEYHVSSHSIFEGEGAGLDGVYVPANTGVLVKNMNSTATSEDTFYYTIGEKTVDAPTDNLMTGIVENPATVIAEANMYVMSKGQYRYVTPSMSVNMPIHKAYLNLADAVEAGAKIVFLGEVETAIEAISNNEGNDDIYNLTGAKVSKMQSGIYVKNGKKIYVK